MKSTKVISRIIDVLILSVISMYLISAGFRDSRTSGWYQQWFPNLNGSTIKDITFLDSLTGFAVTDTPTPSIYSYILKTTNGGDNWVIDYNSSSTWGFRRIISTDSNTIFAVRSYTEILKTTNRGNNWQIIPMSVFCDDISILNKDTMLVVNSNPPEGGVYRSTNGGINWSRIWTNGSSGNPSKIYMYDKNMGFACTDNSLSSIFYRTSNGGLNWTDLNDSTFRGIQFTDSLIGWKQTRSGVKKTTNGGLTWFRQTTPYFFFQGFSDISVVNKDMLWYVGSAILKNNYGYGVICKTTNGGLNWGYQLPDTAIRIGEYVSVNFINKNNGWAYQITTGVHTKVGGNDSTVYTGINNNVSTLITDYQLFQNYPNPFNAISKIKYKISRHGGSSTNFVQIKVFDISGKEVTILVNERKNPGEYSVSFNGRNLSSGIYFYSMAIDGNVVETKRMMLLK